MVCKGNDGDTSKWGMALAVLLLAGCAAVGGAPGAEPGATAGATPMKASRAAITTITLERSGSGRVAATQLSLHRDGRAVWQTSANQRLGGQDETRAAAVSRGDFDALASLIEREGFFGFEAEYADPTLAGGSWLQVGVERAGVLKQVFSREGAGPAGLHRIVDAIELQRGRLGLTATSR